MNKLLLALTSLALASCGGPVLFAEVEVPRVCVTLLNQTFDATAPGQDLVKVLPYDLSKNLPTVNQTDATYELRLTEMTISLKIDPPDPANLANFADVTEVNAGVLKLPAPLDPTIPANLDLLAADDTAWASLVSYTAPSPMTDPPPVEVPAKGQSNIDLSKYIEAGQLYLRAQAKGTLPDYPWTANVQACFYMKVTFDYGKMAGL